MVHESSAPSSPSGVPLSVLLVGLGGGGLPQFLRDFVPEVTVEVVELDPVVLQVAKDWFGFRPDERLTVTLGDGLKRICALEGEGECGEGGDGRGGGYVNQEVTGCSSSRRCSFVRRGHVRCRQQRQFCGDELSSCCLRRSLHPAEGLQTAELQRCVCPTCVSAALFMKNTSMK